jgi:Mn-containing catalase
MFFHKKALIHDLKIEAPSARFAQLLLEQFGGATGELTAGLQYWVQSFHVDDPSIRDMLQDIAVEEFGHLEMVGRLVEAHTRHSQDTEAMESTLFAVRGIGPHFLDSQGVTWSAKYINEGGDVVRDLRANLAAEAGARQTYEALIKLAPDYGTRRALVHLLTREIAHTQMFMDALAALGKLTDPMFGNIAPDSTVDLYFNLSKDGEPLRGPWNAEPAYRYIDDPQPMGDGNVALPAGPTVAGQTHLPSDGKSPAATTPAPVTHAPTTPAATTPAPVTHAPVTHAPTTPAATTPRSPTSKKP